jgi:hypothetical protein
MKTLNNYILERLNPKHLGYSGFPIDGTIEEMIKYLENYGFERIPAADNAIYTMNNQKGRKVIWVLGGMIRFADVTKRKISEKNPAFAYNIANDYCALEYSDSSSKKSYKQLTKDEFLSAMHDVLGI